MSMRDARDRVIALLQSAAYATKVAEINAHLSDTTIAAFSEVIGYSADVTKQHPVAMVLPASEEYPIREHTGFKITNNVVRIIVEDKSSQSAEDAINRVMAVARCVASMIDAQAVDSRFHGALVRSAEYGVVRSGGPWVMAAELVVQLTEEQETDNVTS